MTRSIQPKSHFPWFDWLRFGAALMVVLAHTRVHTWVVWSDLPPADRTHAFEGFLFLIRQGSSAVVLFFVLSGYLVGGKLWERVLNGRFLLRDYFTDRLARIYVPLIPALAVTVIIHYYVTGETPRNYPGELAGNLFSVQGILCSSLRDDGALWSLSYEVWFYILGGAIATVAMPTAPGGTKRLFVGLVVLLACLGVFTILSPVLLFCWILGASAYVLSAKLQHFSFPGFGGLLAVAGMIGLAASASRGCDGNLTPAQALSCLGVAAGAALILPRISRCVPTAVWSTRLESFGSKLAAFSYTLYLTHIPLLALYTKVRGGFLYPSTSLQSFGCFGLMVLICVAFAYLLHLPFERQTPEIRKWLRSLLAPRKESSSVPLEFAGPSTQIPAQRAD